MIGGWFSQEGMSVEDIVASLSRVHSTTDRIIVETAASGSPVYLYSRCGNLPRLPATFPYYVREALLNESSETDAGPFKVWDLTATGSIVWEMWCYLVRQPTIEDRIPCWRYLNRLVPDVISLDRAAAWEADRVLETWQNPLRGAARGETEAEVFEAVKRVILFEYFRD